MSEGNSAAQTGSGSEVADALNLIITTEGVEGLIYGVAFTVAVLALYLLMQQGLQNSPSRSFLSIVLIVLFVGSTIMSNLIIVTAQVRQLGNPDYDPYSTVLKWTIVSVFSSNLNYLLGDLIVIWRTWILFEGRIVIRVILATCVLASIGGITANITLTTFSLLQPDSSLGSQSHSPVFLTGTVALLFTNVVATVLVGYKAWLHRNFLKAYLGEISRKSQVEHVLILLTESGSIYCGILLLALLDSTIARVNATATDYLTAIVPHATTIYPAVIILLTALRKTHCDSTLQGRTPSQSIRFASGHGSNHAGADHVMSDVLGSTGIRFASYTPSGEYHGSRQIISGTRFSEESFQGLPEDAK
ncbi:hypothetical protein D9758_007094 [Tetrapyrgos nigripes]|uniref:Uncharacterized protein n=1 Tax=Tetrapyrgos nigripes TaxID=182062 RepID=A0A8H5LME1_9AGAR|nr:hypothetical protein D9758_007094 [Tetrapyrgos nigripes]